MKTYVTAVEALRKMIKQAETPFITKIGGKTTLGPSYFCFGKFSFPVMRLMPYIMLKLAVFFRPL
jgi:hypothetical protein